MYRRFFVILAMAVMLYSCKKWKDEQPTPDSRLTRPYCNDPEAVNYNWDFPGKPDNTTCFFPTEVFSGAYSFTDSLYSGDLEYDTFYTYNISLVARSKSKFVVTGFCQGGGKELTFTADRYYRAAADSLMMADSTFLSGQIGCRAADTLSGLITKDPRENNRLRINFTVLSDTGTTFHIGTAIKQ
jgi:hypothetical protein